MLHLLLCICQVLRPIKNINKSIERNDYRLNLLQLNPIYDYKQKGQRPILAIVRAVEKRSRKQSIVYGILLPRRIRTNHPQYI